MNTFRVCPFAASCNVLIWWIALALSVLALSGCQGRADKALYIVNSPAVPNSAAWPASQVTVAVELPIAPQWLEGEKVAIRRDPYIQDYYAGIAWAEPVPDMLQHKLIETLERTGKFRSVSAEKNILPGDYMVSSELRKFQVHYAAGEGEAGEKVTVEVALSLSVMKMPQHRLIAAHVFEKTVAVEENNARAIMRGFDSATQAVLLEVAPWVHKATFIRK